MYKITFVLAGIYNLAFGIWTVLWPHLFFDLFGLDSPRYPAIWACLGMVVGIYGLLYLYAARWLEYAYPIITIGLLGKVLGPIGFMIALAGDELPARMLFLLVFNDLIWWLPFTMYLLEETRIGKSLREAAPNICAGLHLLAVVMLIFAISRGSEVETDLLKRAAYIRENLILWRLGWVVWMISAVSLIGFYAWWGAYISSRRLAFLGIFSAACGLVCDLFGESIYIAWLPYYIDDVLKITKINSIRASEQFLYLQQLGTTLTAVFANGLYTLGGIVLTIGTKSLEGWFLRLIWVVWLAGIGVSVFAVAQNIIGIIVSTSILFPAFIVCCILLGRKLR